MSFRLPCAYLCLFSGFDRRSGKRGVFHSSLLSNSCAHARSDYDAVMVIVCTHGGQDGVRTDGGRFAQLVGTDGVTIPFDTVYDLFGGNESLKGKPKIFLIQVHLYCRVCRVEA